MRPTRTALSRALYAAFAFSSAVALRAQADRMGQIADRYNQLCAQCHGPNLQGTGQGPSLLKPEWLHGGDDESIARSIRNGFPDKGMPPWGTAGVSEKEIRAMVIFLREQRSKYERGQMVFAKPAESMTVRSELHAYQLHTWIGDLSEPWSLAFLPGNRAIVTEKRGRVYLVEDGRLAAKPLRDFPDVEFNGQAGLFDVVPHPKFAENGWIYFAFADPQRNQNGQRLALTRIIRGKIRDGALVEQQDIFHAPLEMYPRSGGPHFGGRIAFDRDGYLFFTVGERGTAPNAQNLRVPMGKVHRVFDDGRVPDDNPFRKTPGAFPSIWSYGHRNPQGLAFSPTGELYDVEHGPRGGDEVNLVRPGRNYGWPVITYGMDYPGVPFPGSEGTSKEGMEQPVTYYVPSIAPCGANFYGGDLFPKWKGNLFIGSLAAEELRRLEIKSDQLVHQEVLFKGLGRIRDVIGGPDGALYVLLPTRIVRITPATGAGAD